MFKLGFPFNKLFKEIERQFKEIDFASGPELDDNPLNNLQGLSISIDTSSGQPVIRINNQRNEKRVRQHIKQPTLKNAITQEQAEKFSNLPKEEPETKVKRLANKLLYELLLPGVKKENVLINKLENSIEIKAFSDKKAFFKLIPLSLPIISSNLKEETLTLELKI